MFICFCLRLSAKYLTGWRRRSCYSALLLTAADRCKKLTYPYETLKIYPKHKKPDLVVPHVSFFTSFFHNTDLYKPCLVSIKCLPIPAITILSLFFCFICFGLLDCLWSAAWWCCVNLAKGKQARWEAHAKRRRNGDSEPSQSGTHFPSLCSRWHDTPPA